MALSIAVSSTGCATATTTPSDGSEGPLETQDCVIQGTVVTPDGVLPDQPWVWMLTRTAELPFETDAEGRYCMERLDAGEYSLQIRTADDAFPHVWWPVEVAEGDDPRTVDVIIPPLDNLVDLPEQPAPLDLAPGLRLEVGRGVLVAPLFMPEADAVGAVSVPNATDMPHDGLEGDIVAAWHLDPLAYEAPDGLALRIEGLPPGPDYTVWSATLEGGWQPAGSPEAATLFVMSTVVVTAVNDPR